MLFNQVVLRVVSSIVVAIAFFAFNPMSAFANYAIYPQYRPVNILEIAILLIVIAGLAIIVSTALIRRSQDVDDPEYLSEPTSQQTSQDMQEPQILQDIPRQTSMKNEPRLSIDIEKIPKGS